MVRICLTFKGLSVNFLKKVYSLFSLRRKMNLISIENIQVLLLRSDSILHIVQQRNGENGKWYKVRGSKIHATEDSFGRNLLCFY